MYSYSLTCGNCNNLVDFVFESAHDYRQRTPEEIYALGQPQVRHRQLDIRTLKEDDLVHGAAYSQCPRCCHPTLITYESSRTAHESIKKVIKSGEGGLLGGQSAITVTAYFPEPKEPMQNPLWPDSIRRKFSDAQTMLAQNMSPSIILTTCGSILELALKELDQTDERKTLYRRIEDLHAAAVITTPIKDWAHDIRLDRNDAVHEGEGDVPEAAEYIEFLNLFFTMVFSLPSRIAEKRAASAQNR